MAKLLKLRRGTTSQHSSFTGAEGEVTVNTDKDTLVVHDGSTSGGHELLRKDLSNLPAGQIDNADVNSSANIAGTKISPNFGSQNIVTTGSITCGGEGTVEDVFRITDSAGGQRLLMGNQDSAGVNCPKILSSGNGSLTIGIGNSWSGDGGTLTNQFTIGKNGVLTSHYNHDFASGIDVTGYSTFTHSGTNPAVFIGSGSHEMYAYHDSAGAGWASGAGGTYGELVYLNETNSQIELYAAQGKRFTAKSTGCVVTGSLDVTSSLNLTGTLTGDRAVFQDDGSAGPTVSIMTDDNSPWALSIGNDTYSNADHKGLMFYQNNNGDMYTHFRGVGAYEGIYFQTSNSSSTYNFLSVDSVINTHLHQGTAGQIRFACDGSEQVSVRGGTNYARISMQNSSGTGGRGGYVQSWSDGSVHEIGFARPNDGGWFIRNDRNDNSGAVVTYIFNDLRPATDNNMDLGSSSNRWRNIYTTDLQLSNEGGSNDVDGTWGNWTLQEGEDQIFMLNNRSGKKYKINLTEVS